MPAAAPTLTPITTAADWRSRARCRRYATPDDFHPEPKDWATAAPWAALTVCSGCPVAGECLDEAIATASTGIWGGLPDTDRALAAAGGWQLGQPIPPLRPSRVWVTLAEAATALGIARRRVRGWVDRGQIEHTSAPLHYGQPTTLVDLDQCCAHLEAA